MSNKFSTTPFSKKVNKPWGYEIIFTLESEPYTGKIQSVNAGKRWSLHYHDKKQETICLFSGKAFIWLEDSQGQLQKIVMEPHKGYVITPGQKHRIEAVEDSIIIESSMPEIGTSVRIEDDYARGDETDEVRKQHNRGWAQ